MKTIEHIGNMLKTLYHKIQQMYKLTGQIIIVTNDKI